jgi:DNA-binding MurR/RpiR family transcriptional regulator
VYATDVPTGVANATDSFAARIAERAEHLAPAERRVADQLAAMGPPASLLSAAALAERLGTSDATVVRTAKSLGYRGLSDMRTALAAYASEPPIDERLRRTLDDMPHGHILESVVRAHLAGIEAMTRNVSSSEFQAAVSVLQKSERVVWRGVGPSAHLARYGQLLTRRVGKPSAALVHTGTSFADELLDVRHGDAVVVFAYGRPQPHVRVLLEHARSLRAPVVLMTDGAPRKVADRSRTTMLRIGRGAPGLFSSHGVTLVVVEAIVLAIADAQRSQADKALTELNELRAELLGRRIDVDTQ